MSVYTTQGTTSTPVCTGPDLESQKGLQPCETSISPTTAQGNENAGLEDNSHVPHLSLLELFWFFFYNFGLFAWGGPVAQIALIKDRIVIKDKWITIERFQRVFSVY